MREQLARYFLAGISAVDPLRLMTSVLRHDAYALSLSVAWAPDLIYRNQLNRVFVVGGGKAGRTMGDAVLRVMGDLVTEGVMAVPKGHGGAAGPIRYIEAGHPVPDIGGISAAREILVLLEKTGGDDLVIALFSGGGSSMISSPADGITVDQKAEITRLMLRAGADIYSLNTVRKHLSEIKGGLLARVAHPATVWALLLSDVSGDDPSVIASGPFAPDPTTYADAIGALEQYGLLFSAPAAVRRRLIEGAAGKLPDTPKPGDPVFEKVFHTFIGTNRTAMAAIAEAAKNDSAEITLLPNFLHGEAHDCAKLFCDRLRCAAASLAPGRTAVLIAGGETTVYVSGDGVGGRNLEFALAAGIELSDTEGLAVFAGGTDGIDGPTDSAGAYVDGATIARAEAAGLDPHKHLADNNSYAFFKTLDDLTITGPTGTNVADLVIGIAKNSA